MTTAATVQTRECGAQSYARLAEDLGIVRVNEPLRDHCTWRIGGPADVWIEPTSVDQLARLRQSLARQRIAHIVIGDGSNLLFDDAGVRGAVVCIGRALSRTEFDGMIVRAHAGVAMSRLAFRAGRRGLTGLEHTVGIPGTLGGLVHMNGGSLRQSIGQVVRRVTVCDATGRVFDVDCDDCGFGYRRSRFQGSDLTIAKVELELRRGEPEQIRRNMLDILRTRRVNFPRRLPSCGSVFLSDPDRYHIDGPTGWVIEQAGCKGWREVDAEVSRRHANFIINRGRATSRDVLRLIDRVRRAVHDRTGRWLRCEARYVSPAGRIMPADEALTTS